MTYIRYKTIKGKRYAYEQTSVRQGKKVKTISKYLGAVAGGIAAAPFVTAAIVSALREGDRKNYGKHKSTDERAKKHQELSDRERFEKEMQNPKERFQREARKTAAKNASKPPSTPDPKIMDDIREFNERRAAEANPPKDCPS